MVKDELYSHDILNVRFIYVENIKLKLCSVAEIGLNNKFLSIVSYGNNVPKPS